MRENTLSSSLCVHRSGKIRAQLGHAGKNSIEILSLYEKSQEIKIKDLTDTVPYFCPPKLTYK